MNQKLKQLALEVGGSHFPDVSKQYLEQIVRRVVHQCAEAHHNTRLSGTSIEKHFLQEFDLE